MKLKRKKWSSFLIVFFSCALIVFFIPSCGFWSGENTAFTVDSGRSGPGDGDEPTLGPRLNETPDLADKECEDNDRCEEACRKVYEDQESYRKCYKLTIGEVSKIELVFHALLDADRDDLEDIEKEDLEHYIKIDLDGWRDKVVRRIKEKASRNERFQTVLNWIVDIENEVIPILETEDQDNEILEELFLGHCHRGDGNSCQNNVSPLGTSCPFVTLSFDYTAGYVCAGNKEIVAFIEEEENKQLFLSLISGGEAFFKRAAETRRFSAFILGNKLVEKACSNRNETSLNQCIAAFYCHLRDGNLNQVFFKRDDMIEGIGREIGLMGCDTDYSMFVDIL